MNANIKSHYLCRPPSVVPEDRIQHVDPAEKTLSATFESLGGDNLDHVELLMEVEKDFGIWISDYQVDKLQTFGDLLTLTQIALINLQG